MKLHRRQDRGDQRIGVRDGGVLGDSADDRLGGFHAPVGDGLERVFQQCKDRRFDRRTLPDSGNSLNKYSGA